MNSGTEIVWEDQNQCAFFDELEACVRWLEKRWCTPEETTVFFFDRESIEKYDDDTQCFGRCLDKVNVHVCVRQPYEVVVSVLAHEWGHLLFDASEEVVDEWALNITAIWLGGYEDEIVDRLLSEFPGLRYPGADGALVP